MDEPEIRMLLHDLQLSVQKATYSGSSKRTRWINISCPLAPWTHQRGADNTPSFGITIKPEGRSAYKCFACGVKGRLAGLPSKLGGYRKKNYHKVRLWAEMAELQSTASRRLPDWEDQTFYDTADKQSKLPSPATRYIYPGIMSHAYLAERGIRFPTPIQLGLTIDQFQKRILFPCFDQDGSFRGFTGRSYMHPRHYHRKNPKVRDYFGLNKREIFLALPPTIRRAGPKIIVEGLFDYAKLVQAGFTNTMAILGTALTDEKIDILIEEAEPVYFFMDNDLAGWTSLFGIRDEDGNFDTSNAWAYRLQQEIPIWIVPYRSVFNSADPGSYTEGAIKKAIKAAWLFTGYAPMDHYDNPNMLHPRSA